MRNGARAFLLVSSILAASARLWGACAEPPPGGGMLGPNPSAGDAPAFFDSDGSGGPSPCDEPILPTYDAGLDRITLLNPFQDCDGSFEGRTMYFETVD